MLARLRHPGWLIVAQLAAFWPVWCWYVSRMTDGSDEPLGILALITVLVLAGREERKVLYEGDLIFSTLLMLLYAVFLSLHSPSPQSNYCGDSLIPFLEFASLGDSISFRIHWIVAPFITSGVLAPILSRLPHANALWIYCVAYAESIRFSCYPGGNEPALWGFSSLHRCTL